MTPLMDLTFMLLIIFVITVPVLDYSTEVAPPKMTTPNQVDNTEEAIMVVVDKEGVCKIDGAPCPFHQLEEAFKRIVETQGKTRLLLRADGSQPYENVVAVMRAANHAGIKLNLMTQAED